VLTQSDCKIANDKQDASWRCPYCSHPALSREIPPHPVTLRSILLPIEIYRRIAQIDDLIEEQTSADDAERSKPHPDIFEAALARLQDASAEEAVAIGDSPYGAIAAGKVGMVSIGVLSGGFPEDELRAAGYSEIYEDCAGLLQHYGQSLLTRKKAA